MVSAKLSLNRDCTVVHIEPWKCNKNKCNCTSAKNAAEINYKWDTHNESILNLEIFTVYILFHFGLKLIIRF